MLQEHWLHNFEQQEMNLFLENFNCFVKSTDDLDPISPFQRPRGSSGIAICYRHELLNSVEEKTDGSTRIAVIKLAAKPKPILIIGAYIPCRGTKNADKDFLESLDVISEIINKYSHTCDVILTGDMNTSLNRQTPNSRGSLFLNFIKDHHVLIPSCMDETNTYYHPSGSSQAQIDYILEAKIGLI